ncbi:hypothetical protein OS493_020570 [Desmophyllum pertusum]|uniref:NACHT domain-containing protein n=1 Tax=Desmophyllum pertusum TaxID=174260 RepID=A0A9W9Z2Q5_9CNID|nr:hypothetical protein OS493_020570 [Desmophyllum pertusum]
MGHAVDQTLLSLVKELITKYKRTEADQDQQRTEQIEIQNTVASLQDQHDEQLEALMEWKEQLMKETKGILEKLVAVEKTLSEELLNRVQGVEESLSGVKSHITQTDERVKQLEENAQDQRKADERAETSPMETFDVKTCRSKLAEHYKRTAMVPTSVWSKKSPVHIHQIYTRLSLVKEEQTPEGSSQSELTHYTDVFTANENGAPNRILVQGQTGIGKSTFVKKLADEKTEDKQGDALERSENDADMSEDNEETSQDYEDTSSDKFEENQKTALKKFELVLVINLKEVSKCRSLRDVISRCSIFPEEETALTEGLLSYITNNQEKVLLVFDGYDEYRCGSNSEIYDIFRGKKLRNCCVLITTRISKGDELREFKDVHAEITGFSEEDREAFMRRMLGGETEAKELSQGSFSCSLWQVEDFKEILAEIGKVALECLLKDDHVFEYDQLSAAIPCEESIIIGLLQVSEYAENLQPAGMVSFIHKSIQEFLAAWYITYRCVPEGNLGGIEEHAPTLEDCEALENVFQFICGLSDDGAVKVLNT